MPVLGFLLPRSTDYYKIEIAAFPQTQGPKETGYVEGRTCLSWISNQIGTMCEAGWPTVRFEDSLHILIHMA